MLKKVFRRIADNLGYEVYNRNHSMVFSEDLLSTYHNQSFIDDPRFQTAYARACEANDGVDHKIRWRAHVAFWASEQALRLGGDVVECGVSTGFLMSGIMQMHDWNTLGKTCYLFDTFTGLVADYVSEEEAKDGRLDRYSQLQLERVQENFSEFERVEFVVGPVPDTLTKRDIGDVCYLSLDMNSTIPEMAAMRHFWPKVVPGGWVVLDDYAYSGYEEQHYAYNELSKELGFSILTLPTGQGLIQKPVRPV